MTVVAHPDIDERRAHGKSARDRVAPAGHAGWVPAADRPDPVALLEDQNVTREPDLVPVRHGRMMVSPFTFYRGAAKIMAADLKDTPTAGLNVQLCGDAHLSNFGVYASPERALVFDLNDFDETLAGAVRIRREAHGGEFRDRRSQQRLPQVRHSRHHARVCDRVQRGNGPVRRDADDGHLVRAVVGSRFDERDRHRGALDGECRQDEAGEAGEGRSRRTLRRSPPRRARATAWRPCPSSPSASTVATGSSPSRRSSCPWPRPPSASAFRPIRSKT